MDRVIFRKFKNGDIIALLPDNPVSNSMYIDSYMHTGQHGEASIDITRWTKLATPDEYADLLTELKAIGYDPIVYKRINRGIR